MASTTPATTHPCGTPYSASGIPPADASPARAKFEPPDGFAYFGFTFRLWDWRPLARNDVWGDVRPFAERLCDAIRVELAGKTPTIITVHSAWPSRPERPGPFRATLAEIRKVHAAAGPTVVPRLEWQSDRATTREIASGAFDDYIYRYARGVRRYGQPLFIRPICGEFNGFWWQWCSPEANHDLTAADFVNAWRRVVDIFRREGVNNVAWIWTPVAFPPPPENWGHDPDWQAYYPGDDYVDWVGGDLNDWGLPSWLDPLYRFGLDHDKPFFLAEFAIRHEGTEWTHEEHLQWLTSMFDYFEAHPQIKAISYFNYKNNPDHTLGSVDHVYLYDGKVSYVPNVNDHDQRLIAGGEDVRALFASRIADPRYISTVLIEPRRRWRDLEPDEKTASDQARAAPVADPLIDPSEAIPPAAVHEPNRTRRRSQRRHPQEGRGGRPRRDQVAATWTTRDDDRVAGAIVGRTSEIGAFERLLADEIPQPRALLIEGEPGIGKTTLFDGLLEMARGRDCQILSCRPARSEMDPSYVGLMELLGGVSEEVVRSLPPPQARVLNPDPSPEGPEGPFDRLSLSVAVSAPIRAFRADPAQRPHALGGRAMNHFDAAKAGGRLSCDGSGTSPSRRGSR